MADSDEKAMLTLLAEVHEMRDQLSAKDREIAELIAQLDSARQDAEAAERFRATYLRERDEARECVGRLCAVLREIVDDAPATKPKCSQFPNDYQLIDHGHRSERFEISEQLRAALAATPEHLRR